MFHISREPSRKRQAEREQGIWQQWQRKIMQEAPRKRQAEKTEAAAGRKQKHSTCTSRMQETENRRWCRVSQALQAVVHSESEAARYKSSICPVSYMIRGIYICRIISISVIHICYIYNTGIYMLRIHIYMASISISEQKEIYIDIIHIYIC